MLYSDLDLGLHVAYQPQPHREPLEDRGQPEGRSPAWQGGQGSPLCARQHGAAGVSVRCEPRLCAIV